MNQNTCKQLPLAAILGGWDLVHHYRVDSGGVRRSTGEDVRGKLIYSSDGSLAVVITKKQSGLLLMDEISCYAGTFSFDGADVHHHVNVSTRLERLGLTLSRTVQLESDVLTLRSKPDEKNEFFEIIWKKTK